MSETQTSETTQSQTGDSTTATTDTTTDAGAQTGTEQTTQAAGTDTTLLGNEQGAAGEQAKEDAKGEQPKTKDQPIEYGDFTLAEGYTLDDADAGVLKELGQQFKMPQEALQKLVDLKVSMDQRQQQAYQAQVADWANQTKADKEYGGDKLQQSLSTAKAAFALPRGDKVRSLLNETGLGNHPDIIGFFAEVGKMMGNDQMVTGKTNNGSTALHEVLFDKS